MRDAHLRIDDTIFINESNYLHINRVEIFTGDDDYNETDIIEVHTSNNKLVAKKLLTETIRSTKYRVRGEPGIRLFIDSENGEGFLLTICHHKGNIHVATEKLYSQDEQQ